MTADVYVVLEGIVGGPQRPIQERVSVIGIFATMAEADVVLAHARKPDELGGYARWWVKHTISGDLLKPASK